MVKDVIFVNISMPILCRYIYNIVFIFFINIFGASLVAQMVKSLPAVWETRVRYLGREDPLEKEMATQSSILAWKSPWTEEPGSLQSFITIFNTVLSLPELKEMKRIKPDDYLLGLNAEFDILHVQLYSIFLIMLWYECCFLHFINEATDSESKLLTCVTFMSV